MQALISSSLVTWLLALLTFCDQEVSSTAECGKVATKLDSTSTMLRPFAYCSIFPGPDWQSPHKSTAINVEKVRPRGTSRLLVANIIRWPWQENTCQGQVHYQGHLFLQIVCQTIIS